MKTARKSSYVWDSPHAFNVLKLGSTKPFCFCLRDIIRIKPKVKNPRKLFEDLKKERIIQPYNEKKVETFSRIAGKKIDELTGGRRIKKNFVIVNDERIFLRGIYLNHSLIEKSRKSSNTIKNIENIKVFDNSLDKYIRAELFNLKKNSPKTNPWDEWKWTYTLLSNGDSEVIGSVWDYSTNVAKIISFRPNKSFNLKESYQGFESKKIVDSELDGLSIDAFLERFKVETFLERFKA